MSQQNPWVRPYVLTGGRTKTNHQLYVHTLVSSAHFDARAAAKLTPESRRLYDRVRLGPQSVAELSAHCGISLGVTRVLLEDLASTEHLQINEGAYDSPFDHRLLKRVIDGLSELG
ncbi:DUF742 domain-containing protein [Nocardioides sp. NPDC004968]|uniref:DUF742 domain-containing protein n=1 Tax=Nocardioides sp. NPDC004968 TaxID=3155894 RepID=UPI0033A61FFE